MKLCACGQRKTDAATRCQSCATAHRRPMFRCEWCSAEFWRRRWDGRDYRRFCSHRCANACTGAQVYAVCQARRDSEQAQREIDRELRRAAQRVLLELRSCSCGGPITRPHGTMCTTCAATHRRERGREHGIKHLCPNCGQWFRGLETDVYCSPRCARQLRKKGRYPSIASLATGERNRIAELIALIRAARRRIEQPAESQTTQNGRN